ncbi:hypothetical protein LTS09_018120, partial [Friedmanniomyces endolithicus]
MASSTRQRQCRRIEELVALAYRTKAKKYHNAARNAMAQAQQIWTPWLGIDRPAFSAQKLRELDVDQRNKANKYHDAARDAMAQAQQIWTPGLGIDRPAFSAQELRELNIDQIETLVDLAQRNAISGW